MILSSDALIPWPAGRLVHESWKRKRRYMLSCTVEVARLVDTKPSAGGCGGGVRG
jgi:hypothetical protein